MKALRWVTGFGVILIAAGAFALSYGKLYDVGERAQYGGMAWIYPSIIEGFTTLCTLAAFLQHGKRGAWYPWMVGVAAFAYSLWANSLPASVPVEVVRAVPVICIPLAVHMFIIIAGLADKAISERKAETDYGFDAVAEFFPVVADVAPVAPVAESVDEPEPVIADEIPQGKRRSVLASPATYIELAERAKSDERRKFWLKMAETARAA